LLSAGPLIFTGAGFASIEGVVVLARLLAGYEFTAIPPPVPLVHFTVRARDGIWLWISKRSEDKITDSATVGRKIPKCRQISNNRILGESVSKINFWRIL
jgi:hypothetical protein